MKPRLPFQRPEPMKRALISYAVLAVTYILLVRFLPASQAVMHHYNLSLTAYHVLLFLANAPSLLIWFVAFYGYARLVSYAQSIPDTAESVDFHRLGQGAAWLAWSLPLTSVLGLGLNSIAYTHAGFHPAAIIIINYLAVIMPLIGFSLIANGSRGLSSQAKVQINLASARSIILIFVTIGVLYCYLTFRHFDLGSLTSSTNPYYLPVWLMVLTVVIPYLYAWFIGLFATYELSNYSKQIKGLLYRQALRMLAGGLIAVIVSSIATQYITSASPRTGVLLLNQRLVLVYIARVIGGIGFVMIAFGVSRLKRIEDV